MKFLALAAAAAILAPCGAVAAQDSMVAGEIRPPEVLAREVWTTWDEPRMTALLASIEGEVLEVNRSGPGVLGLAVRFFGPDGPIMLIDGQNCTGEGPSMTCRGAIASLRFVLNDVARAEQFSRQVNYGFVADAATENGDLVVMRYVLLDGGATRENVSINLQGLLDLGGQVAGLVFGPGEAAPDAAPEAAPAE